MAPSSIFLLTQPRVGCRLSRQLGRSSLWLVTLLFLLGEARAQVPQLRLVLASAAGTLADPTTVFVQDGATVDYDPAYDAPKLLNPNGLNLASLTPAGQLLAINALPPTAFSGSFTLPLSVGIPEDGQYRFTVDLLENFGASTVYLVDAEQNGRQALSPGSTYAFTLTGASTGGTYVTPTRFSLAFEPPPLPVQLVKFTARRTASAEVALDWRTASELNNQGFEVQRSADGNHWMVLAFLPGTGNSAQAHTYTYTDAVPPASATYYRLRQRDQDGLATYSAVAAITAVEAAASALTLYPNPVTNALVQVGGADATTVLRLLDAQGRLMREWPAGTTSLDALDLPAGLYLLRAGQATQRLVIQ